MKKYIKGFTLIRTRARRNLVSVQHGFTLIELIIVLTILAFLVLMVIFMSRKQLFKGNDARRKGDIHNLQAAIEEYQNDKDCYPLPTLVACQPGTGLASYIAKIPCDPVSKASYFYDYENSSCPKWYRLYAKFDTSKGTFGPNSAYNYTAGSPNAPDPNLSASAFYGCKSGICVPIYWDSRRPGPQCDPSFGSPDCLDFCGTPAKPKTECSAWNQ